MCLSGMMQTRRASLIPIEKWCRWFSTLRAELRSSRVEEIAGQPLAEGVCASRPPGRNKVVSELLYGTGTTREKCDRVDSWSKLCEEGQLDGAFQAFTCVEHEGIHVSIDSLYRLLKWCIANQDVVAGRRVHALAVRSGYVSNAYLANHIIRMYASYGSLQEARQVFIQLSAPDRFVWGSIISAHVEHGEAKQAIQLYNQMRLSEVEPHDYVYVAALKACVSAGDLPSGRAIHTDVVDSGYDTNIFVGTALVDMYTKLGRLDAARRVFDKLPNKNVVTWSTMIAGYSQHGQGQEALNLYESMQRDKVIPDVVAFLSLLKACTSVGAIQKGKQIHAEILDQRLENDISIGSTLVDMYAKSGNLDDARAVFDRMSTKNIVTWSALISGYAHHEFGHEALNLYEKMRSMGMTPDRVTYVCTLKACASIGAMHKGKDIHAEILERGLEADVFVGNTLVDMYGRNGYLTDARNVFDRLPTRDVVTWNALINSYGQHNSCEMATQCFEMMRRHGVEPNGATFACLLVACSHASLADEGQRVFEMMEENYGISPTVEHYTCMVDLLGRSGRLDEAESLLQTIPLDSSSVGWMSLLSACKSHGDVDRGRRSFNKFVELEPKDAGAYVLMSSIYASAGRWDDLKEIESFRRCTGAYKKAAKTWIEVNDQVHEFVVGEDRGDTSLRLQSLNARLKESGYVPQTDLVLKPISDREKEDALCGHAEKLALAYGLLNTPEGKTLLVTKNLRMCDDCHSGTKVLSRIEKRDIIVRDAYQVHRFRDGLCTCEDSSP